MRQVSDRHGNGFACPRYLHPYTRVTTDGRSYPPVSPHRLATRKSGHALPATTPKGDDVPGAQHQIVRHGRFYAGTGISTGCPSTTPVGLALGPDLPWADEPGPGTLGHSVGEFLTPHSLLMPAFSLVWSPRLGSPAASPPTRRSPTHPHDCTQQAGRITSVNAAVSVVCLSPATLSARNHLTSELLRTL
jgi:hypothetical protein